VELNPFDGVCLGTFPASTGLFLWDTPGDGVVVVSVVVVERVITLRVLSFPHLFVWWGCCHESLNQRVLERATSAWKLQCVLNDVYCFLCFAQQA